MSSKQWRKGPSSLAVEATENRGTGLTTWLCEVTTGTVRPHSPLSCGTTNHTHKRQATAAQTVVQSTVATCDNYNGNIRLPAYKIMNKYELKQHTSATTFSQTLYAMSIIDLAFFRIGQHFICKTDLFKLHKTNHS